MLRQDILKKQQDSIPQRLLDLMLPENGQDFDFWQKKWDKERRDPVVEADMTGVVLGGKQKHIK